MWYHWSAVSHRRQNWPTDSPNLSLSTWLNGGIVPHIYFSFHLSEQVSYLLPTLSTSSVPPRQYHRRLLASQPGVVTVYVQLWPMHTTLYRLCSSVANYAVMWELFIAWCQGVFVTWCLLHAVCKKCSLHGVSLLHLHTLSHFLPYVSPYHHCHPPLPLLLTVSPNFLAASLFPNFFVVFQRSHCNLCLFLAHF